MSGIEQEIVNTFGCALDADCLRGVVHLVARAVKEDVDVGSMDYTRCLEWLKKREDAVRSKLQKLVMVDRRGRMYGNAETLCSCVEYAYVRYE